MSGNGGYGTHFLEGEYHRLVQENKWLREQRDELSEAAMKAKEALLMYSCTCLKRVDEHLNPVLKKLGKLDEERKT